MAVLGDRGCCHNLRAAIAHIPNAHSTKDITQQSGRSGGDSNRFMMQGRSIMTYVPLPGDGRPHVVTLIPGDGIGPEVTDVVTKVVDVLGAPLVWER